MNDWTASTRHHCNRPTLPQIIDHGASRDLVYRAGSSPVSSSRISPRRQLFAIVGVAMGCVMAEAASAKSHFLTFQVGYVGTATSFNDFTKQETTLSFDDRLSGKAEIKAEGATGEVARWFPVSSEQEIQGQILQSRTTRQRLMGEGEASAVKSMEVTYSGSPVFSAQMVNALLTLRAKSKRYDMQFTLMADMATTMEAVTERQISKTTGAASLGGDSAGANSSQKVPLMMGTSQFGVRPGYEYLVVAIADEPLVENATQLSGSKRIPVPRPADWNGSWEIALDVSWAIEIGGPPVELEVTMAGYEAWLPKGSIAQPSAPGNHIVARATLKSKDGQGTELPPIKSMRFNLSETSQEPGVCLNWPLNAKDDDYDLRLALAARFPGNLSGKDQQLEVSKTLKNEAGEPFAEAQIDSYDFGGSAELRVVCVLEDGREIVGFLNHVGAQLKPIPLPYRESGSRIAHAWRDRHSLEGTDADDRDETPVGDGNEGDGFSNYEEYRGFAQDRMHVRTKPDRKDLFVRNRIGARALPGLFLFADLTHLSLHYELRETEMPESREMNANRSASSPRTSAETQHGLILDLIVGGDASITDIDGSLWRPKNVERVRILAELLNPGTGAELESTIAHELLHAIGVRHHGEGDDYVAWLRKERVVDGKVEAWFEERPARWSEAGFIFPGTPGERIRIFRLDGSEVMAAAAGDFLKNPVTIFLGHHGRQHSGDVHCVMRYHCAEAFVLPGRPRDRFVSPGEPVGSGLCASRAGTEFNAAGPAVVRYGNASLGNCEKRFCVRDDAPEKNIP